MSNFEHPKSNPPEKGHEPLQKEKYGDLGAYAAEGSSLWQMKAEFNVSRETIRKELIKRNLHGQWKERRKEVRRKEAAMRKDSLKDLAETIYLISLKKAEKSRPLRKALERHYKKKTHKTSFESIVSLFEAYYEAKDSGEKLSLMELGERCGISFTQVGMILKEAEEKPLYGARERKLLSEEGNRLAETAIMIESNLSYKDMGKIIGVPSYVLHERASRIGKKHPWTSIAHPALTYSKAIDLFEALDAGFSKEDAMQYAQISSIRAYEIALARRRNIEREVYEFRKKIGLA